MYIPGDSQQDSRMRYSGGIMRVGKRIMYLSELEQLDEERLLGHYNYWNSKEDRFNDTRNAPISTALIDVTRPKTKLVPGPDSPTCFLFGRAVGDRQYSMVVKTNNTVARCPVTGGRGIGGTGRPSNSIIAKLMHYYDTPHPDKDEAYEKINSGDSHSVAVTDRIALGKVYDTVGLWLLDSLIAELEDKDTVKLIYPHKYFKEEIEEAGYTVKLVKEDEL